MPATPEHMKFLTSMFFQSSNFGEKAAQQLGTLGGGNHFIEIQATKDGYVGVMIHSGSRNLGKQVADAYNNTAKMLNQKWHTGGVDDLAYLPAATQEGQAYLDAMNYCVDYALLNRELMMSIVKSVITEYVRSHVRWEDNINIAHNYARVENHFGKNVMVHRKGATSARKDELGVIPGSQGSNSYIVKGLGEAESFHSCSHGAGRKMGRNHAKKTLSLETELSKMDGIVHGIKSEGDLDEAPGAYKDIHTVMLNQTDLVEVVDELTPLAVVKG